jgi:hypothetical protein
MIIKKFFYKKNDNLLYTSDIEPILINKIITPFLVNIRR